MSLIGDAKIIILGEFDLKADILFVRLNKYSTNKNDTNSLR